MFKKFFSKKRKLKITLIVVILVLIISGIAWAMNNGQNQPQYSTVKAVQQKLFQTVSEAGTVKSAEEINLSFPIGGGRLASKLVKIGDEVVVGQALGSLDSQSLEIQKSEAVSNLQSAQASLNKLVAGVSTSDVAVSQAQVSQAKKAYDTATDNLNKLTDNSSATPTAYEQAVLSAQTNLDNTKITSENAINNNLNTSISDVGAKLSVANTALDNVKKILDDQSIKNDFSSKNFSFANSTKINYDLAKNFLNISNASLLAAKTNNSRESVEKSLSDAIVSLNKTSEALDGCYNALQNSTIFQATLDTYKAAISVQIAAVSSALSLVQGDQQNLENSYLAYNNNLASADNSLKQSQASLNDAINAAKNSLAAANQSYELAKSQLAQLRAPARYEDVSLAQANVQKAQASLDLASKQIDDSTIKSPIIGRVVRDDFEIGEQIPLGQPVFAVLAENQFEIEVDISESDITKVKEGDRVQITLDAFGSDQPFNGMVSFVEPAETIIQDVVYYKVRIAFIDSKDILSGVKSGMTANVTIITNQSGDEVVVIPERAVIDNSGKKIVRILRDEKIIESPVELGLKGDDGLVEVKSGVVAGDDVVVFVKTK